MIKEIKLICFECKQPFDAKKQLYYKDNFNIKNFNDIDLLCLNCLKKWKNYWKIADAEFIEEYASLYVKIILENGDVYEKVDCTAMDDIVATSMDIPTAAQKTLYHIYKKWYDSKMKDCINVCTFNETFMRTSFTCSTYGGQEYIDIAFRFNRSGIMETEKEVPDVIKKQIIVKWNAYELQNVPLLSE